MEPEVPASVCYRPDVCVPPPPKPYVAALAPRAVRLEILPQKKGIKVKQGQWGWG